MSFFDPPLPPFLPQPFFGCDVGVFWPQIPMNNEDLDSNSQFENAPPLKRPRNPVDNQPNSSTLPPLNRINVPNPIQLNRGTGHIFYKTRMCLKFLQSNCGNGDYCTFAHGPEELREPPPNWQEIVAAREKDRGHGNWDDDQRIIHKMKICRKFYNGEECPYGDKCNFLHEDPSKFRESFNIGTMGPKTELRSWSDQPEVVNKSVNANAVSDAYRSNDMKPAYWKTRLCIKWETTGQCLYGERCHFAHGHSELQVPGDRLDDAKAVHNTITIPTKPVCALGDDVLLPLPCKAMISAAPDKENAESNKFFSKWKGPKKINRIYADWIDDLTPPPPSLPSKVES